MTVGIDDGKFFLIDNWPGIVTQGSNPSSWTTPSATEDFPLGTKRAVYDDTNNGWATLMFAKYIKGTAAAVAVKGICSIDTSEMATAGQWCHVCNDGGESQLQSGCVAVALATMSTGQYGWFWVGGVCPVDTVSGLDGVYKTDDSVTAGTSMKLVDNASILKFEICTGSELGTACAFSLAADSNVS